MPPEPSEEPCYDLILVGAGSASSLLASRLSHHLPNHRILVLEAGQNRPSDPKILTPGLAHTLHSDPAYDWSCYASAPEPGLNGRRIAHPRGKLVGGTSAINSHSVVFPNREWQDRVAELVGEVGKHSQLMHISNTCMLCVFILCAFMFLNISSCMFY